jgi:hypothetical protein
MVMPVIYQKRIYREDLRNNPSVYYLFGDNEARKGFRGQAAEMRGERNAIGIRTKKFPTKEVKSFWTDAELDRNKAKIDEDFAQVFDLLRKGCTIVMPTDGIGVGLSEMPKRCPQTYAYLKTKLDYIYTWRPSK